MNRNISIVLVEPENPDNIGAVARAMKNMGLGDLRLVSPPKNWKRKSKKMAMSAFDVIESANVFDTLASAIHDKNLVVGTSRRRGPKRGTFLPFPKLIDKIAVSSQRASAIVFGKESKGLSNRDLNLCDWVTAIPAHSSYPSLNLSQAVMVIAFSVFVSGNKISDENQNSKQRFVAKGEMLDILERFEAALIALNYEREGANVLGRILKTFHRLIGRSGLLESESQMFKGLTRRIVERSMQN